MYSVFLWSGWSKRRGHSTSSSACSLGTALWIHHPFESFMPNLNWGSSKSPLFMWRGVEVAWVKDSYCCCFYAWEESCAALHFFSTFFSGLGPKKEQMHSCSALQCILQSCGKAQSLPAWTSGYHWRISWNRRLHCPLILLVWCRIAWCVSE